VVTHRNCQSAGPVMVVTIQFFYRRSDSPLFSKSKFVYNAERVTIFFVTLVVSFIIAPDKNRQCMMRKRTLLLLFARIGVRANEAQHEQNSAN